VAKVLVVDDHALARKLIAGVLRSDGHLVETAATGTEMMHVLLNDQFDAVVLDLKIPHVSGVRLARVIRRNLDNPPGIVLFSAMPLASLSEIAARLGVRHYLSKGCGQAELRGAVRAAAADPQGSMVPIQAEFVPSSSNLPGPLEAAA
jgi:CheY-like chemotaxis protein